MNMDKALKKSSSFFRPKKSAAKLTTHDEDEQVTAKKQQEERGSSKEIEHEVSSLTLSDADLQAESLKSRNRSSTPHPQDMLTSNEEEKKDNDSGIVTLTAKSYHFVPLRMGGNGGTHVPTKQSASLLDEIGGVDGLQRMTESFYAKAFQDATLDPFLRSKDDPHGRRFATWIHQKLGGEGNLWDQDRRQRSNEPVQVAGGHHMVVHDRSSAHVAAWHSPRRPRKDVGRHFKLDECRVWMRLHFWAMREVGLLEVSPSFVDYYVRFIGHFVAVYERSAPTFARDAFRWSADRRNVQRYENEWGRKMKDVLGVGLGKALKQIPKEEAEDDEWPYGGTLSPVV